jgi:uncharacterized protein YndB with AHSA1/START domain
MKSDILLSVDIQTTPQQLYEAITTQQGLAGWYTPKTKAEPRMGAVIELKFDELTTLKFHVDEIEAERHVIWSGVQVPTDWEGTHIRFDMTPQGNMVNLQFSQTGLPPAYEDLGVFSYLWGQYLRSLKVFLETGEGEPFGSAGSRLAGTTPQTA